MERETDEKRNTRIGRERVAIEMRKGKRERQCCWVCRSAGGNEKRKRVGEVEVGMVRECGL